MLAFNAKVSADQEFEFRCRHFVFRSVFTSSARLVPATEGELETDCIDIGFLEFPYVFGALSVRDSAKRRMRYRRGGGG